MRRTHRASPGIAYEWARSALDYNHWLEALKEGRFDVSLGFGSRGPTPYPFYHGQMDGALVRPIGEAAVDNFHRFASAEAGDLLVSPIRCRS